MQPKSGLSLLLTLLLVGCAHAGGGSPVEPGNAPQDVLSVSNNTPSAAQPNRYLWGLWKVHITADHHSAGVVPLRAAEMHLNTVRMLEGGRPCSNCLTIGDFLYTPPNGVAFSLTLRHPFPGNPKRTGFDVRGIFIFEGDYTFPESGRYIAWGDEVPRVLNADGYTHLFNPTEFPETDPPRLGYIPGKHAEGDNLTATLNPFLAYRREAPRRMFEADGEESWAVSLRVPAGPLEFGYAVDACWAHVAAPVTDPLSDFPATANCIEAYRIDVDISGDLEPIPGSSAAIEVEVYDHQGQDTVQAVYMEAPDLFADELALNFSANTGDDSCLFTGAVPNDLGAPVGDYPVLVRVVDTQTDENLGAVDAWQVHPLEVVASGDYDPVAKADAYPLPGVVGIPVNFFDDGSYDPDGGSIVKYEWDWDNDGAYDEQGREAYHYWDTPGIYQVQFRVTDDEDATGELDSPMEVIIDVAPNPVDVTPPWLNFSPNGVCVDGNLAYIAGDVNGLHIFDISDPSSPVWVSRVDVPGVAQGVDVSNGYAYVAATAYDGGLHIVDVDPPEAAHIVGFIQTMSGARDVAVSGGYAYVADSAAGLQVVDIDPPESAHIVRTVDTPGPYTADVAVAGGFAYVADDSGGLQIVDIDPPESAHVVGSVGMEVSAKGVAVSGGYAYVADYAAGLKVVDIDPPESAHVTYSLLRGVGLAEGIDVWGGYAYMTVFSPAGSSIYVVGIDLPGAATVVGEVLLRGRPQDVAASSGYAFVANRHSGLQVADVDPPGEAHLEGAVGTPGSAQAVAVHDGHAYVSNFYDGLEIIDVDPPESAQVIGSVDTQGLAYYPVATTGSHAFVACDNAGLRIIDIDPPESAHLVGSYETENHVKGVDVSGGYAYVADWYGGLRIVDVSTPETPNVVWTVPGLSYSVTVSDGYAYVAVYYGGLRIVDIDPPESAHEVGSVATPSLTHDVAVSGGYAYVADEWAGMHIVDIDPIDSAHIVNTVEVPGYALGVAVSGAYAFVADGSPNGEGLQVIRIDPPETAHIVETVPAPGYAKRVTISGGYVYMADSRGGLRIIKLW